MFWPCETRTSTCRSFATISSGLYRFLAIAVLLDVKDIPQVGPLQWGWIMGIVGKLRGEAMIDNRTQVFDVAMKNARTIEACLDRLAMMGADHELKMIAGRLSRLTFRAAPSEEAMSTSRE
jgi:hypothetical protein